MTSFIKFLCIGKNGQVQANWIYDHQRYHFRFVGESTQNDGSNFLGSDSMFPGGELNRFPLFDRFSIHVFTHIQSRTPIFI
jgi:hypothetical protein